MADRAHVVVAGQVLAHAPDLVLSGSKPSRELERDPGLRDRLVTGLRSLDDAARYLPNQVFIGAAAPRPLGESGRPWWSSPGEHVREGRFGLLLSQSELLAAMHAVDTAGLVDVVEEHRGYDPGSVQGHLVEGLVGQQRGAGGLGSEGVVIEGGAGSLGRVAWGYPGDDALAPGVVLENVATKATAAVALSGVLGRAAVEPGELDWVISCSEEAVGDRYQRGGGNMGKAVAEAVGARRASGFDVKNFCAAPISALVVAASLVESGVGDTVAVVAGGSVPKLGMKFQGHLAHDMPVLEDCLGGIAILLRRDGDGPTVRLDTVGRHSIGAGGSAQQIFEEVVFRPLEAVGLKATDIDMFGTELHNPELTEPQGSGDVPLRNYRMIGALAARREHVDRAQVDEFLAHRSFAGFAPTQGHIASAVCLLPHVLDAMAERRVRRAQLVAKASLFLGKMSGLSDGGSVIVEV